MSKEINSIFTDIPLKVFEPDFGSDLTSVIIDLEKLRINRLGGPVHPRIFFQLKDIFQWLESLGSARIEGNNTTLVEFVEKIIKHSPPVDEDEKTKEILNIESAIRFVEENINKNTKISEGLLFELHKILVKDLTPPDKGEGSNLPGKLRVSNVRISNSRHIPPDYVRVPDFFRELIDFVNKDFTTQHHLLMVAIAHHRMTWIHPFDNGNGRMVRIFTYALLIKQGFQIKTGRILNPSAIFCMDRNVYYDHLALADTGERKNMLNWCEYVLRGLRNEIEKIDRLLDRRFMNEKILIPALTFALDRKFITPQEHQILIYLVRKETMEIKSADIEVLFGIKDQVARARMLGGLKRKGMLVPTVERGRIYTIGFANNYLLRGIMQVLEQNGFVPESLNKK
jgi:Fic family protein